MLAAFDTSPEYGARHVNDKCSEAAAPLPEGKKDTLYAKVLSEPRAAKIKTANQLSYIYTRFITSELLTKVCRVGTTSWVRYQTSQCSKVGWCVTGLRQADPRAVSVVLDNQHREWRAIKEEQRDCCWLWSGNLRRFLIRASRLLVPHSLGFTFSLEAFTAQPLLPVNICAYIFNGWSRATDRWTFQFVTSLL